MEVHLKNNGKDYIIPAGYMNRAMRRKWTQKMRRKK